MGSDRADVPVEEALTAAIPAQPPRRLARSVLDALRLQTAGAEPGCAVHAGCVIAALLEHIAAQDAERARLRNLAREAGDLAVRNRRLERAIAEVRETPASPPSRRRGLDMSKSDKLQWSESAEDA